MNGLKERIAALIEQEGPLTIADYMTVCLFDPAHGYYTTREPFGVEGDFTTAPEISQMFGELVAIWLYSVWQAAGSPRPVCIAEIGPGRGTLTKDVIRTLSQIAAGLARDVRFALVEASPRLTQVQKKTLAGSPATLEWYRQVGDLPQLPVLFVGNEIFDAIPMRQFVHRDGRWRERCVGLSGDGELAFVQGPGEPDPSLLPADAGSAEEGSLIELAPARSALMDAVAGRIASDGGAGIFFDYGHLQPGYGDTLQAVRRHAFDDVLARPGEADLTSHVDFAALSASAGQHGLAAHVATQGDFLIAMGLRERAGLLGRSADAITRERIVGEARRLAAPDEMGDLFKVLAVTPHGLVPPGFAGRD